MKMPHTGREGEGDPRSQGLRVWSNKGSPCFPWGELIRKSIDFSPWEPRGCISCFVGMSPLLAAYAQIPVREVGLF